MFTTKYKPDNIDQFIGNKCVIQPFESWLLEWNANNIKKCALVSGINGIGKSSLTEIILKKYNFNTINLSIDNERDKETLNKSIKPLLKIKKTFFGQNNCLVVSDIDCSGGDYGFISTLTEFIKETQIPIICMCDDRYNQNIKPILNYCFDIKLIKPSFDEIYRLIYKVVTTEKIKISKSYIDKLFEQSNGDIRFILNNLQFGCLKKSETSKNIQSLNIFYTTEKILSMETTIDEKLNYYWMSPDIQTLMIHENYVLNTFNVKDDVKRLENISNSADSLSDSDLFDSVFNFELSPYVAISTIKATNKCNKKNMIKFSQFLGKTSIMNKNKREKLNFENVKFFKETKIKLNIKSKLKTK